MNNCFIPGNPSYLVSFKFSESFPEEHKQKALDEFVDIHNSFSRISEALCARLNAEWNETHPVFENNEEYQSYMRNGWNTTYERLSTMSMFIQYGEDWDETGIYDGNQEWTISPVIIEW